MFNHYVYLLDLITKFNQGLTIKFNHYFKSLNLGIKFNHYFKPLSLATKFGHYV
jgi:hypothetical protein